LRCIEFHHHNNRAGRKRLAARRVSDDRIDREFTNLLGIRPLNLGEKLRPALILTRQANSPSFGFGIEALHGR
jgi:hypothetical protein